MSHFYQLTHHPVTGEVENALWLDPHRRGEPFTVRFESDQSEWSEDDVKVADAQPQPDGGANGLR